MLPIKNGTMDFRVGKILVRIAVATALVCSLLPSRAQAQPLDLSDPTPRAITVEFEISLSPSFVGMTYSVPFAATYSASGNTGTVVISGAVYETAILTGDLDYYDFVISAPLVGGSATDFTLAIDLTTTENFALSSFLQQPIFDPIGLCRILAPWKLPC